MTTRTPAGSIHGRTKRKSGSVLVAVLAMIMLLSFLVTQFMDLALEDLEYRAIYNEPMDVNSFAFSMLEVTLATVQEVALIEDGKLHAPEQGWNDPIGYADIEIPNGWDVSVQITDESNRLPINTMSETLLNKLFEETLEFDFGTSRELSSTLLDWIDSDENRRLNGAESDEYENRNPPYRAANGPLQSLDELRLLQVWEEEFFDEDGKPNEVFNRLSSMVSVYNTGPINLNSTSEEVLELLALEDGYDADFLFDGLDRPYLEKLPPSADASVSGVETRLLRVNVSVHRGEVPYTVSALVETSFGQSGGGTDSQQGGRKSKDVLRTGTTEEQQALNYPFRILHLSEYEGSSSESPLAARYSDVDIPQDSPSFSAF